MLNLELPGLRAQMFQMIEPLEQPELSVKAVVKTFDVRIAPGLIKRDEDNLNAKV